MKEQDSRARGLRREIIMYIIFGVLTTVVSFGVYYAVMAAGRAVFGVEPDETGGAYIAVYTAAQLISWLCAVLFAFFTNRAWVFTDSDKSANIYRQLISFAAGRLLTLGLDYVITLAGSVALLWLLPSLSDVHGLNLADLGAKAAASVVVMICNYVFSRVFVFKKGDEAKRGGKEGGHGT